MVASHQHVETYSEASVHLHHIPGDGAPGKTPTTRLPQPSAPDPDDVDDGDGYSRVSHAHGRVQALVSALNGQEQKKGKTTTGQPANPTSTEYAEVNKKGKKGKRSVSTSNATGTVFASVSKKDKKSKKTGGCSAAEDAAVYSEVYGQGSKPSADVYAVVNKKPKKPVIAPKPGHLKRNTNTSESTLTGDTTATDSYETVGAVASPRKVGSLSAADQTDDYNSLNFHAFQRAKENTKGENESSDLYNDLYSEL